MCGKCGEVTFGRNKCEKIQQVPLSNNTIKRCILFMSTDAKQQVIAEIRSSLMFAEQLDESTDVASCSWYLFDIFIRKMLKKSFCIAILWKLQEQLKI